MTVGGAPADKPTRLVAPDEPVEVLGPAPRFVSRGGEKLAGALDAFALDVTGRRALDAGSSTGGFTDCLLQRGAAEVVAVDVGPDSSTLGSEQTPGWRCTSAHTCVTCRSASRSTSCAWICRSSPCAERCPGCCRSRGRGLTSWCW